MRRKEDQSVEVLCGVNPILEQLRQDSTAIRRILVSRGATAGAQRVVVEAGHARVPLVSVNPRSLGEVAGTVVHQGVVAEMNPYRYAEWGDLLARKPPCLLAADQVTDPRNLGAIIRSAEAAGVGGMILPRDRSASVN
ncbi:MAG: TrmH family RNA methyltransferase, partial [bacterium]